MIKDNEEKVRNSGSRAKSDDKMVSLRITHGDRVSFLKVSGSDSVETIDDSGDQ